MTRYFRWLLSIRPISNILLIFYIFFWLSGSMSGISFITSKSGSTDSSTEIYYIYNILIYSESFNLYISGPNTFAIQNSSNFIKSNLSLGLVIWIKVILILDIYYKRYNLSLFFRISILILKVFIYFFILLLKNSMSFLKLFYNLWIFLILISVLATILLKLSF